MTTGALDPCGFPSLILAAPPAHPWCHGALTHNPLNDQGWGGGGLAEVGRCGGTHRALGEPATGPWEGRGGGHLTLGAQSFRRTATPARPVPDP